MRRKLSERFRDLEPSSMMRMFKAASRLDDAINLCLGEPDVATDPSIVDALWEAGRAGETHYAPSSGFPELRAAIRDRWEGRYGLSYDPGQVLVTTGGSQACHLAFQALLEPGDEVLLLEPYFTFYAQQVLYNGGVPRHVLCREERGFLPDPGELERAVTPRTKILVVNSPCNPTGAVFDGETLEGIADVARRHDLLVLSDELYESFVYEGGHIPLATLPGMKERTLTVGGFSKSFAMCGWRIGYVMGPEEILRPMDYLAIVQTLSVNSMVQRAALHALEHCDGFTRRLRDLFEERVRFAAGKLRGLKGLSCADPRGSFYLLVNVEGTGRGGEAFAWEMLEGAGVVLVPGTAFGPDLRGYVRVACTVEDALMEEACGRMGRILGRA